jgi:hypothetical protein
MSGSLPVVAENVFFPTRINNKWTKVLYKSGRTTKEKSEREAKHTKESEHWLNQTSTSNRYTALLEEGRKDQQQIGGPVTHTKTSSNLYN